MIHSSTVAAQLATAGLDRVTFYNEGPGTASILIGAHPVTADAYTLKLAVGGFVEFKDIEGIVSVAVSANGTRLSVQGVSSFGLATL